ncbi:oligosaccharide flippase family protein [Clostridium perfringens]|nr:oligosaccharide flippase family protein [Clostridium perfringens]
MKNKSIKKNFVYNLILTTLNIIFPLIISPYISRVLAPSNIGKVNYATSVANWFILLASFGIPRYGIREVSRKRKNDKELSNAFWNLFIIQSIFSLIAIIIYLFMIFSLNIFKKDLILYVLMLGMIILNIFSIDWFYQGIEEYGYITLRNIIVKIISLFLIFFMIKKRDDFLIYAAINIFALGFNNILNYLHSKRYLCCKLSNYKFKFYVKELRIYFLTTLIIAIYTQLDQVFIGTYSSQDLAYYVRSKMIVNIGIGIVGSIITVLVPRTAYLIENNYLKYKNIINESINYIYILSIPCFVGVFLLSKEIMLLLGGNLFLPATMSLKIIAIIIIINPIGTWQINQILIPHKKEKLAFYIQFFVAILSLILDFKYIPKYSFIAASVIWVLIELILVIIEGVLIRKECKEIKIEYFNINLIKYIISAFFMGILIIFIKKIFNNLFTIIFISVISGCIIYFMILFVLKDSIVKSIIGGVRNKIKLIISR